MPGLKHHRSVCPGTIRSVTPGIRPYARCHDYVDSLCRFIMPPQILTIMPQLCLPRAIMPKLCLVFGILGRRRGPTIGAERAQGPWSDPGPLRGFDSRRESVTGMGRQRPATVFWPRLGAVTLESLAGLHNSTTSTQTFQENTLP